MLLYQTTRWVSLIVALSVPLAAASENSDPTYRSLRDAGIRGVLAVQNVVLRRDVGTLTLKSGTIGFTAPVMGRDTVAVFVGEGDFQLTPVQPLERDPVAQTDRPG